MATRLNTKRKTLSIPGMIVGDESCGTSPSCCNDLVTPGAYDCTNPSISLSETCVMTLSASIPDPTQFGILQLFTLGNTPTACGTTYQEGSLDFIRAWPFGSYPLQYLGKYAGNEIAVTCSDSSMAAFETDCDYHIYTYSKNPIIAGKISSGGPATRLESVDPLCCCGTYPHVFLNETLDEYELAPLVGTYDYSLCGQGVGFMTVPCDIDALTIDCASGVQWYSQDLVTECVGDACVFPSIPIPNGDVYGGLYCDSGTSKIVQYPYRNTWTIYRNVVFWIPSSATETELCCTEGGLVLQTYVIRRRWYNDGVALIQFEPTVYTYTTGPAVMEFAGDGTVAAQSSSAALPNCTLNPCLDSLEGVNIEINA